MPDGTAVSALSPPAASQPTALPPRWVSPLLRRILLVNALPLVLLVAALLYLDQYQNGLLEARSPRCANRRGSSPARWGRARSPSPIPRTRSSSPTWRGRCCTG